MATFRRSNLIGLKQVAHAIATDLLANGFAILSVDGVTPGTVSPTASRYIMTATLPVDPFASTQQWVLGIHASDDMDFLDFNAAPRTQLVGNVEFAFLDVNSNRQAGYFAPDNDTTEHFIRRGSGGWRLPDTGDDAAYPISYLLTITDHGISFCAWAEGQDMLGYAFSWFVIQRPVTRHGLIMGGKSPLFCLFSNNGGGHLANWDELDPTGILRYTVIEADVSAATSPVSAVQHGPDSASLMNPMQQVALSEDGNVVIFFPQSINTARYVYPWELDLIAYTSADVISTDSVVPARMYGESSNRFYRALNANAPNNTGMRLLLLDHSGA